MRSCTIATNLAGRSTVNLVTALSSIGLAILIGLSLASFQYAKGHSYLSTDSAACANRHIMWPQYEAWLKSSHKAVAGCQVTGIVAFRKPSRSFS